LIEGVLLVATNVVNLAHSLVDPTSEAADNDNVDVWIRLLSMADRLIEIWVVLVRFVNEFDSGRLKITANVIAKGIEISDYGLQLRDILYAMSFVTIRCECS
jgi:hypothetical protein